MPTFDEVRAALRVDDLDTAVTALSELARGGTARHAQESTLHAARLERLRQRERAGLLTASDASVERNRLVLDLSDFARSLESDLTRAASTAQRAAMPTPTVAGDLSLGGGRFESLVDALLAAFPTPNSLARLVRFRLDQNLSAIATGTLQDQVFALVQWAEANGRVRDLVEGARGENPGNPKLAAVAATLTQETAAAPAATYVAPTPTTVASSPTGWVTSTATAMPPTMGAQASGAGTSLDATTWQRAFRAALSSLYGSPDDALRLTTDAGMPRARIDFTGSMQTVWFRVIEEAAKGGHLSALMRAACEEYPQHAELARLAGALAAAPIPAAVTWTSQTLLDALQRLLVPQFEELLFRLVVPMHYLPPATAPMTERAIALVRVCEQTGRTGELGAALERLGVRPRG